MARNRERDTSQETLSFDGPINLPEYYDLARAKAAAKRRDARIGRVARIKGFKRRTGGLFVPQSGTENSAVVELPEVKAENEKRNAAQRVQDKYDGDISVSTKQVDLWKHFAAHRSHSAIRRNYRGFESESASNAARIGLLVHHAGGITRGIFTFDPDYRMNPDSHSARNDVLAYNSVLKYLMALEAFTGDNPELINKRGQRKWPHMAHKHAYRERMIVAHETLEPLAEDIFAERVDEAYWSHDSRNHFWVDVNKQHDDFVKQRRRISYPPAMRPIELIVAEVEAIEQQTLQQP